MKPTILCLLAATLTLWAGCTSTGGTATGESTGGRVVVTFDHPDKFTDAQTRANAATDEHVLAVLRDDVVATAAPRIPAGSTLAITFTDIDLAGSFEPWRVTTTDIRMLKEIYPPRARFNWTLTGADGTVLRQGSETLLDANYLTRMKIGNDPLFYDKEMLNDWIRRTFR